MSPQTLSDDFDEKIADITAQLRDELTGNQYGVLWHDLKGKKLADANRHLKAIAKRWKAHRHHHRARYERFATTIGDWNDLMARNGGPKRAAKLARKRGTKLPAARPYKFAARH